MLMGKSVLHAASDPTIQPYNVLWPTHTRRSGRWSPDKPTDQSSSTSCSPVHLSAFSLWSLD